MPPFAVRRSDACPRLRLPCTPAWGGAHGFLPPVHVIESRWPIRLFWDSVLGKIKPRVGDREGRNKIVYLLSDTAENVLFERATERGGGVRARPGRARRMTREPGGKRHGRPWPSGRGRGRHTAAEDDHNRVSSRATGS